MAKQYFSHDSNAKDDPKTIRLIDQLGLEAYGAYWVLIELLRDQPSFRLPIAAIPRISRTYNITSAKLTAVINSFELFEIDGEFFFSRSLTKRMSEMSEKGRVHAAKRWGSQLQLTDNQQKSYANPMPTQCQPNAIKGKEIKGKESIEERKAPTHNQVKEKFFLYRKGGWSDVKCTVEATNFFDHYESVGWKINGHPMENWEARVRRWISDERTDKKTEILTTNLEFRNK
jgi:hypothetical protein